jgi:hypothetical protein
MKFGFDKYWWDEFRSLLCGAGTHWRGRTSGYFHAHLGPITVQWERRREKQ